MKARSFALLPLVALAALAASCAVRAPEPMAPATTSATPAPMAAPAEESAPADSAANAEDAEQALVRAEKDLDASLAERAPAGRAVPLQEPGGGAPAAPCDTACRAFSSMTRAAEHLCAIAGSADERCGSARERLQRASERVRAACPACTPTSG